MSFSLDDLEKVTAALRKPPLYYIADHHIQKQDEEGHDVVFGIEIDGETVALVHPDHLNTFIAKAKEAGFDPQPYPFKGSPVGLEDLCPALKKWRLQADAALLERAERIVGWLTDQL